MLAESKQLDLEKEEENQIKEEAEKLLIAARVGNINFVEGYNSSDDKRRRLVHIGGVYALMEAAKNGYLNIVQELIQAGVNFNFVGS